MPAGQIRFRVLLCVGSFVLLTFSRYPRASSGDSVASWVQARTKLSSYGPASRGRICHIPRPDYLLLLLYSIKLLCCCCRTAATSEAHHVPLEKCARPPLARTPIRRFLRELAAQATRCHPPAGESESQSAVQILVVARPPDAQATAPAIAPARRGNALLAQRLRANA